MIGPQDIPYDIRLRYPRWAREHWVAAYVLYRDRYPASSPVEASEEADAVIETAMRLRQLYSRRVAVNFLEASELGVWWGDQWRWALAEAEWIADHPFGHDHMMSDYRSRLIKTSHKWPRPQRHFQDLVESVRDELAY